MSPKYRHVLMQGVLCAVLGLTLLLAMLVVRQHRQRQVAALGEARPIGGMMVRGPEAWEARQGDNGWRFDEPGRRLEIWRRACPEFISPLECLVRGGDLRPDDAAGLLAMAQRGRGVKPVSVGGWPGIMLSQTRLLQTESGGAVPRGQTLACGVLPDGQAVLIRLEIEGIAGAESEQLVRRVAGAVVTEELPALAASDVAMEDDLSVRVPDSLIGSAGQDLFRIGMRLHAQDAHRWVAMELVPCIVLGGDGQSLASMLRLRDPGFVPGPVRQVDEQTWACERADGGVAPAMAYLLVGHDGRALLAEFRWIDTGRGEARLAEALWEGLRGNVVFEESAVMAERLRTGVAAVAGLPEDAGELMWDMPEKQEWQWYHESWSTVSKMVGVYGFSATDIRAQEQTEGWMPPGGQGVEVRSWSLSRTWDSYKISIFRTGMPPVLSQGTRVDERQLETLVYGGQRVIGAGVGSVSPLFVPGGVLPLALGRLPLKPMVLQADSIIWPMASASPEPLTLVLEPSQDIPKLPEAGGEKPMDCWRVRISGLSGSSRWYLDPAGRVHSVSYPNGVRLQRKEAAEGEQERAE